MESLSPNNFAWLEKNLQDMDTKINFMSKLMRDVDPSPEKVKMCKLIEEFHSSYQLLAQQYGNLTTAIHKNMPELWDESSLIAENTMAPVELNVRIKHTPPSARPEVLPASSSKQKKKISHAHESSSSDSDSESSSSSSSDSDAENEGKGDQSKLQDGLVDTLPSHNDKETILDTEVQCRLHVLEEENQNLRKELSSGHIMKNILEEKVLNLEEKNKEEVSALIVKNLHLADALREGSNCLKEYEKKIICLETSIHEARKETLNLKEENGRLKNDLKMQQESGMLIMSQVDKLQNEISEMVTENTQLKSLGQETEIEIQVKVDEIKKLESEITSIRVPLSNMDGLQALADNLMEANNGLQVQLEGKNLSLLKLENEVKELQISVSSFQAECQMHIEAEYVYLDKINQLEESLAQVQIINHEAIMVKNSKEHEIEKLHELLEDLMLSKVHEIQKLQESAGRMQDENKALKGQIIMLEAQRTEKAPGEQVQSKEGQIIEMGRIISDLHNQLENCKEDYKTLEYIHEKCKDSTLSITEEMSALYKSLNHLQLKCNGLEIESSGKSEKIHKLQDEMNLEILEKSKVGNEKLELTQQVQVHAILIQRLQDEASQLCSSISRCKSENMNLKDANENGLHKITILERDIEHLQQQLKVNEEEKQVLISVLMEEKTKMDEVIQITERKNSELTFELQDKIAIIQQLEGEVHTLQENLLRLQLENKNIQHQMVSGSQELLKQKEQTNAFRQELGLALQEIVLLQSQFQSIDENRPAENAGVQQVLNVESGHLQALIKEVHQNISWLQEEQNVLKDEISAKDKLTANLWATVSSLESERKTIRECFEATENEKIDLHRCLEDKSIQIQTQEQEIVSLKLLVSQLNRDIDVNAKAKYESDKRFEEMEAEFISCKKKNDGLNLKLSQFQDNVTSLEVQFLERCTENNMLQGSVNELNSINQVKVDKLKQLESEIFRVQASILRLEEERENLMTSNQKGNEEISILRKHLEQIETHSSSLEQEKEVLESEMAFALARNKKLESDIHMHILERKELEMEFEEKQVELLGLEELSIDLQAQLQEWQEKYEKLEFQHGSIEEEKKLLHMQLQQEQEKLDLLEQECDAMKVQSTSATNEVSRLEAERSALQDDLHLSNVENSILHKNMHEYQDRVNRLESLVCELQNKCEKTMQAHEITECLMTEIKVQMQSVEEHNTILKEKIYKLQDELNLELLKKTKMENEKLELDQQIQAGAILIQKLEDEALQLRSSMLKCESANLSVKHAYENSTHKVNVLEKDIDHLQQKLTVAEEEKQVRRSVHMEEKGKLEEVIQIMQGKNNAVLAELQDKVACVQQLEGEVRNLQADLSHLQLENNKIQHEITLGSELLKEKEQIRALKQNVCEYEEQVNRLESLVSEMQNKCERTTAAHEMAECRISEIKAEVQSGEKHNAILNEKIQKLQDELNSASMEKSKLLIEKLELKQQIQAGAILIQKLENKASELCTSALRCERENMSIHENSVHKINVLEKDVEHLQQQLIVAEEEKQVLRSFHMEEKEKMEAVIQIMKGEYNEVVAALQDKITCIRQLEGEVQNLQADLSHLQLENKNSQRQMASGSQELLKEKEQNIALRQNVCEYEEQVYRLESLVLELQNKYETTRKAHETAECLMSEIKAGARSVEEHNTIISEKIHKLQDDLNLTSLENLKLENEKLGLNQQIEGKAIVIQNLENEVSQLCTSILRCESENMSVKHAYESSVHKINVLEKDVEHLQQQLRVAEEEKQVLRSFHTEEKEKIEAVIQIMKGKNNEVVVALQDKITYIQQLEGEVQNLQADLSHLQLENKNIQHQMTSGSQELLKEKEQTNALRENVCEYQEQVNRLESQVFELQNKLETTRKAHDTAECLISEIKAEVRCVAEQNTILNEEIHKLQHELNSESLQKSKLENERLGLNQEIEARAIVIQNLENEVSQLCTSVLGCERENMSVKHAYESSVHKINVLEKDVGHLQQELIVAEEEKQVLRSVHMEEKEKMDAVIQIMKGKNNEVLAEMQDKIACIRQLECEVQNLQADLSHLQLENKNIQHRLVSGSQELLEEREHTTALRQNVCEYKEQVNLLESLVSELQNKCERTMEAYEMAECLISEMKAEVQSGEEHNAILNEKIYKLQDELNSESLKNSKVEDEKLELKQEIEDGAILIQKLENEASELRTSVLRLESENLSVNHSYENSVQKINVLEKDVERLQQQLIVAEKEKQVVKSVHMEEKEKIEAVVQFLKGKNNEVLAEVQEKIACIRQLECEVQNLQADLSNLQLENKKIRHEMASGSEELLQEKQQTIALRQNVCEYQEQVNRLESLVFEFQHKYETTRKALETAECLISEIKADAQRIEEHNAILNEEIHNLQDELNSESLQKSKLENEKLGLNQQIEARAVVIQNLENEVSQLCTSVLRCERENMSVKHAYESSVHKINVLEKDVGHLQQELIVAEEEKQVLRSVHMEEKDKMDAVIQIIKGKNNEVLAEVQDKIACIRQLECEVQNLQADLSHLQLENKNIQHRLVSGSQELLEEKEHTTALRQNICEYKEQVNLLESLVSELQNKCERTTEAYDMAECLISEMKAEVVSGKEHNAILNEKIYKLQDELNSESLKNSKVEDEKLELKQQIEDRAILIQKLENEASELRTSVLRCESENMSVKHAYENSIQKINVLEKHLQQQLIDAEEEKQVLRSVHMEEKEKVEAVVQFIKGKNNEILAEVQEKIACVRQLECEVQNLQAELSHLQLENKNIQHRLVLGSQELLEEKEHTTALRQNVCEYKEQVNLLESLVSELQNKCERTTKAFEMAECLISEIKAEVQSGEEHNAILNEKIYKLQDELNSEFLKNSKVQYEKLELKQQIEDGAILIQKLENEASELRTSVLRCESENLSVNHAYENSVQKINVLEKDVEHLQQQLIVAEEEKQVVRSVHMEEKEKIEAVVQFVKGKNNEILGEVQEKIACIRQLECEVQNLQADLSNLQLENKKIRHEMASGSEELLQEKQQTIALRQNVCEYQEQVDRLESLAFELQNKYETTKKAHETTECLILEIKADAQRIEEHNTILNEQIHNLQDELNSESLQKLKLENEKLGLNQQIEARVVVIQNLENEVSQLCTSVLRCERENLSVKHAYESSVHKINALEKDVGHLQQELIVAEEEKQVLRSVHMEEKDKMDAVIQIMKGKNNEILAEVQDKIACIRQLECEVQNLQADLSHLELENKNIQHRLISGSQELLKEKEHTNALRQNVCKYKEQVNLLESLVSELQNKCERTTKAFEMAECLISEMKAEVQSGEEHNAILNEKIYKLQDELNSESLKNSKVEDEKLELKQQIEDGAIIIQKLEKEASELRTSVLRCEIENMSVKHAYENSVQKIDVLEKDVEHLQQQLIDAEEEKQVVGSVHMEEKEKIEAVVQFIKGKNNEILAEVQDKIACIRQLECEVQNLQADLSQLQLENKKIQHQMTSGSEELLQEKEQTIALRQNVCEYQEQVNRLESLVFELQNKCETTRKAHETAECLVSEIKAEVLCVEEQNTILNEEIHKLQNELLKEKERNNALRLNVCEYEEQVNRLEFLVSELQNECERTSAAHEMAECRILEIKAEVQSGKEHNAILNEKIHKLQVELNSESLERSKMENEKLELLQHIQAGAILIEKLENEASELRTSVLRCERENMSVQHAYDNSLHKINVVEKDVDHLQQQLKVAEEEKQVLRSFYMEEKKMMEAVIQIMKEKNNEILAELQDKIACIRQLEGEVQNLQADLSHLQLENKNIQHQMASGSQELLKQKEQTNALSQDLGLAIQEIFLLQSQFHGVNEEMGLLETSENASVRQLLNVESRHYSVNEDRGLLETAANAGIQQLLNVGSGHLQSLIKLVRQNMSSLQEKNCMLKGEVSAKDKLTADLGARVASLEAERKTIRECLEAKENERLDLHKCLEDNSTHIQMQEHEIVNLRLLVSQLIKDVEINAKAKYESDKIFQAMEAEFRSCKKENDRLNLVLSQLQDKVISLEAQSLERGTILRQLEAENKLLQGTVHELNSINQVEVDKIKQLESELFQIQASVLRLEEERENLEALNQKGNEEIFILKRHVEQLETNSSAVRQEKEVLQSEMAFALASHKKLENDFQMHLLERNEFETKFKKAQEQSLGLKKLSVDLQAQLRVWQGNYGKLESEHVSIQQEKELLDKHIQQQQEQLNLLGQDCDAMKVQGMCAANELSRLEAERSALQNDLHLLKGENSTLQQNVYDYQKQLNRLEAEKNALQDSSHLVKRENSILRKDVREYEEQVNRLESLVCELQNKCETTAKAHEMAESMVSKIKTQMQSVKEENTILNEKILNLQDELNSESLVKSEMENQKLQLNQQIQAGANLIQNFEDETLRLHLCIRQCENENVAVKDAYEKAIQQLKVLDGDIEQLHQQLTIEKEDKQALRIVISANLDEKRKMEEIKQKIEGENKKLRFELQDKIVSIENVEYKMSVLEKNLSRLQKENDNLQHQTVSCSHELLQQKEHNGTLRKGIASAIQEIALLQHEFQIVDEDMQLVDANEKVDILNVESGQLQALVKKVHQNLKKQYQGEMSAKDTFMANLVTTASSLETERNTLKRHLEMQENEKISIESVIQQKSTQIQLHEHEIESLNLLISKLKEDVEITIKEKDECDKIIGELLLEKKKLEEETQIKMTQVLQFEESINKLNAQSQGWEEEYQKLKNTHVRVLNEKMVLQQQMQHLVATQEEKQVLLSAKMKKMEELINTIEKENDALRLEMQDKVIFVKELEDRIHALQKDLSWQELENANLQYQIMSGSNELLSLREEKIILERELGTAIQDISLSESQFQRVHEDTELSDPKARTLHMNAESRHEQLTKTEEQESISGVNINGNKVLQDLIKKLQQNITKIVAKVSNMEAERNVLEKEWLIWKNEKQHMQGILQEKIELVQVNEHEIQSLKSFILDLKENVQINTKAKVQAEELAKEMQVEIRDCKKENSKLELKGSQMEDKVADLEIQKCIVLAENKILQGNQMELNSELQDKSDKVVHLESELLQIQEFILGRENEKGDWNEKIAILEGQIEIASSQLKQERQMLECEISSSLASHIKLDIGDNLQVEEREKQVTNLEQVDEREKQVTKLEKLVNHLSTQSQGWVTDYKRLLYTMLRVIEEKTLLQEQIHQEHEKVNQLQQQCDTMTAEISDGKLHATDEISRLQSDKEDLREHLHSIQEENNNLQKIVHENEEKVSSLEFLLSDLQERYDMTKKLCGQEEGGQVYRTGIADESERCMKIEEVMHALEQENVDLKIMRKKFAHRESDLQEDQLCLQLENSKNEEKDRAEITSEIRSLQGQVCNLQSEWELSHQIATADTGVDIEHKHLSNTEEAHFSAMSIDDKNNNTQAFLTASDLQDKIGTLEIAMSAKDLYIINLEDKISSLKAEKNILEERISILDKENKDFHTVVESKNFTIQEHRDEIRDWQLLHLNLQEKCETNMKEREVVQSEILEIEKREEDLKEQNASLELEVLRLQDENNRLKSAWLEKGRLLEILGEENNSLQNKEKELNSRIQEGTSQVNNLEREVLQLQEHALKIEEENRNLIAENGRCIDELSILQQDMSSILAERQIPESDVAFAVVSRLESSIKMHVGNEKALQERQLQLMKENSNLRMQINAANGTLQRYEETRQLLEETKGELGMSLSKVQKLQDNMLLLQVENERLDEILVSKEHEIQRLQEAGEKLQKENEAFGEDEKALEQMLQIKTDNLDELEKSANELQEKFEEAFKIARRDMLRLEEERDALKVQMSENEAKISMLQTDEETLKKQLDTLEEKTKKDSSEKKHKTFRFGRRTQSFVLPWCQCLNLTGKGHKQEGDGKRKAIDNDKEIQRDEETLGKQLDTEIQRDEETLEKQLDTLEKSDKEIKTNEDTVEKKLALEEKSDKEIQTEEEILEKPLDTLEEKSGKKIQTDEETLEKQLDILEEKTGKDSLEKKHKTFRFGRHTQSFVLPWCQCLHLTGSLTGRGNKQEDDGKRKASNIDKEIQQS